MFERRLAALEGMEACIATSSGMSAILLLGMGLLKAGDHVICSQSVFGSTIMLFGREFAKFGVETTFVSQTDVGQWRGCRSAQHEAAVRRVADQSADRSLRHPSPVRDCKERRLPGSPVDNCFCSPALQRPIEYGADLVIHSGTKYLDGQGRVIAGAICATERIVNERFVPVIAECRHDLVAVQRLGRAEGPRDVVNTDACAKRACARPRDVARGTAAGRARLLPGLGVASAA
jgi:O-succinylhomoserine sulfhydrylase